MNKLWEIGLGQTLSGGNMNKETHQAICFNVAINLVFACLLMFLPGMDYYKAFLFLTLGNAARSFFKGFIQS
jgi:hypothetical protein